MPSALQLHPPLPEYGDTSALDGDSFALDCTDAVKARGDTLADAIVVSIARRDGRTTTLADYQVSALTVVPVGTVINTIDGPKVAEEGCWIAWEGAGGVPPAVYLVTFQLTLSSGAVINRTVAINVPKLVG